MIINDRTIKIWKFLLANDNQTVQSIVKALKLTEMSVTQQYVTSYLKRLARREVITYAVNPASGERVKVANVIRWWDKTPSVKPTIIRA